MAPRKRRTKKASSDDGLAEEQKQQLLAELDIKVKNDMEYFEQRLNTHIARIEQAYRSIEVTLPKNVREMTVAEYKNCQGDTVSNGQNSLQSLSESVCEKVAYISHKHNSAKKPSAASSKKKSAALVKRNGCSSSLGKTIEQQKRSGLRKSKKPLNSDSSFVLGKHGAATNRALKDDVFVSPAPKLRKRASQIITPKFDLRKPVLASRCRAPRPGETLVSLSGSPLQNPPASSSGDCVITIGGKVVDLSSDIDNKKKHKLMNLQQKIAELLS